MKWIALCFFTRPGGYIIRRSPSMRIFNPPQLSLLPLSHISGFQIRITKPSDNISDGTGERDFNLKVYLYPR